MNLDALIHVIDENEHKSARKRTLFEDDNIQWAKEPISPKKEFTSPPSSPQKDDLSSLSAEEPSKDDLVQAVRSPQCKVTNCIICSQGPPSSFEKGTPIWANILHLVLYVLTESSKTTVTSPNKGKVKRYFHLRDDIYEFISSHWDIICRRERIKNWRHTIGMTLSHYQNLFQNGYHIYQNTGYWSMKDGIGSPYENEGSESSPAPKRRRSTPAAKISYSKDFASKRERDLIIPYTSGFSITGPLSSSSHLNSAHSDPALNRSIAVKSEIGKFRQDMGSMQKEMDSLQKQLHVKRAEDQLLRFLTDGISTFRDRLRDCVTTFESDQQHNPDFYLNKIQNISEEVSRLRDTCFNMRDIYQFQFTHPTSGHSKPAGPGETH